jgi:hypothetical protein
MDWAGDTPEPPSRETRQNTRETRQNTKETREAGFIRGVAPYLAYDEERQHYRTAELTKR